MTQKLRNFYLETQIKNATPGQGLIMLYNALIDHAEQAEAAIASPANPDSLTLAARSVARCIDIMTELNRELDHSVDPVLCRTLCSLYLFFTRELAEALEKKEPRRIRAILPLLRELKEAWAEADRRSSRLQGLAA
jgi:flagellar protein FliS